MPRYSKVTKLAMAYDEAKMLEKHHRAKSRRQYHAQSAQRLEKAKGKLKRAIEGL